MVSGIGRVETKSGVGTVGEKSLDSGEIVWVEQAGLLRDWMWLWGKEGSGTTPRGIWPEHY